MLLEIFRFTLSPGETIAASGFVKLRNEAAAAGALAQHVGYSLAVTTAPIAKARHQITWVIGWKSTPAWPSNAALLAQFTELADGGPTRWALDVAEEQVENYLTALRSPICELVGMRLAPDTPTSDEAVRAPAHKTYTDCFGAPGFVGGDWGYGINTSEVQGAGFPSDGPDIAEADRRLAVYLLGWESAELHEDFSKSPLFAEELVKLGKWIDASSGAWYVRFDEHREGA